MDPEEVRKKYPRESENPFDSDRKLMSTKHTIERNPDDDRKRSGGCAAGQDGSDPDWEMKCVRSREEDRARIEAQNQEVFRRGTSCTCFCI